jgi:hypothetical protein
VNPAGRGAAGFVDAARLLTPAAATQNVIRQHNIFFVFAFSVIGSNDQSGWDNVGFSAVPTASGMEIIGRLPTAARCQTPTKLLKSEHRFASCRPRYMMSLVRACLESPMRVDWGGKWLDARTQIRSIFRNMLRIEDAADGRLPPQGTPGGVSKQALWQDTMVDHP